MYSYQKKKKKNNYSQDLTKTKKKRWLKKNFLTCN